MYTLVLRRSLDKFLGGGRDSGTTAAHSFPLGPGKKLYGRVIRHRRGSSFPQTNSPSGGNSSDGLIGGKKALVDLGPTELIHKGPWIVIRGESGTLEGRTES